MGGELGGAIEDLRDRIIESKARTAAAFADMAATVRELTVVLKNQADYAHASSAASRRSPP
ncbi:MAG: hypothetical protein ACYC8T_09495 [Myxococcaceae bacterium]